MKRMGGATSVLMVSCLKKSKPKGMAAKGAGAPAERGDRLRCLRHGSHRGEVIATYIGRRANHYWFAPHTLYLIQGK